ncbi:MAG: hypothetical protein HOB26_08095 [Flavobacteriales bacterium]|jgi:hypothetical protein|nr:hypothetical protein [Flavobacteriales bacterium]
MKINSNFWKRVITLCMVLSLIACDSEPTPVPIVAEIPGDEISFDDENEDMYNFVMPSPLQIAAIFKRAGLKYSRETTNKVDNVSNYTDRVTKALNFGVYAADLSYCVLNKQPQDALKYMKTIKMLSDDLGMTSMFGATNMFSSFENNISNDDSLIYILATIQENLDEHLENNEEQYMSVIFFAGGWTEGMHIGAQVATEGNPSIAARLIEQMVILNNVIKALKTYPHESDFLNEIITDLEDIDSTYRNFESLKDIDMDDVSFSDLKISDKELGLVIEKIEALRTKITGVE